MSKYLKQILDNHTPYVKRFKTLTKYLDSIRDQDEEKRSFYKKHFLTIYKIFYETLDFLNNQMKSKKGNKLISVTEIIALLKLLYGFPLYCQRQINDGWKIKEFVELILIFSDYRNVFGVKSNMYKFLVLMIDIMLEKTPIELQQLCCLQLNYKVFKEGKKVNLPNYKINFPPVKYRIPRGTTDKADDILVLFGHLFDTIKVTENFEWWWNFLKDNIIRILFPKETIKILELKNAKNNVGFVSVNCPEKVYLELMGLIFYCFRYKYRRDIFYKTEKDIQLVLMIFQKGFDIISPSNFTVIKQIMGAYEGWICRKNDTIFFWEPIFQKNKEKYYQSLLDSASLILEKYKGEDKILDQHVEMIYILFKIIRFFSRKHQLSVEFKSFVMLKVLNLFKTVISISRHSGSKNEYDSKLGHSLESFAAREVFIHFIEVHPDIKEFNSIWEMFSNMMQDFFDHKAMFNYWAITMINLTKSILVNVFKLPGQLVDVYSRYTVKEVHFVKKGKRNIKEESDSQYKVPLDLFENEEHIDIILQMFHRFLSFYGNKNITNSVELHQQKIKVIKSVVILYLNISRVLIDPKDVSSLPHSPEGNVLLNIFYGPLMEACNRNAIQFKYGKLDAIYTLCEIFCRVKYFVTPFDIEYLSGFYKVLRNELDRGIKLIVDCIVRNSWNLFCYGFKGSNILIPDYVDTCIHILRREKREKDLNICALKCLNSLIPILFFYKDSDFKRKETVASLVLRKQLFNFYESEIRKNRSLNEVQLILWGLHLFLIYEMNGENKDREVLRIVNILLSTIVLPSEKWRTSHEVFTSLAQSKMIRRMKPSTIKCIVKDFCFKVLSLTSEGESKIAVSLIYTMLEIVIDIPFKCFVGNLEFSNLLFKIINFARDSKNTEISTAGNVLLTFSLNNVNNFPLISGSDVFSSDFSEFDFLKEPQKGSYESNPKIHHYCFGNDILYSLMESHDEDEEQVFYLIIRDVVGKHVWKIKHAYVEEDKEFDLPNPPVSKRKEVKPRTKKAPPIVGEKPSRPKKAPLILSGAPEHDEKINTHKTDMLKLYDLYVSNEFPEIDELSESVFDPDFVSKHVNKDLIEKIKKQTELEASKTKDKDKSHFKAVVKPERNESSDYQYSRNFLVNIGLTSPAFQSHFLRLNSGHKFYRRLKHLDDKLVERETVKIAIIYVKSGQENEKDILQNDTSSKAFMEFIHGLGWEIDLENHRGFMGFLEKGGDTGETTHYFSSATTEIIFHISTYIPTKGDDNVQMKKKKHIGNDWVHIVWSENERAYRFSTITSNLNFAANIVVYPLKDPLFRVEILKREGLAISPFGPLLDNMIVDKKNLFTLVRQTAVNANKAIRYNQTGFKRCYLIRKDAINEIVNDYAIKNDDVDGFVKYMLSKKPTDPSLKKMDSMTQPRLLTQIPQRRRDHSGESSNKLPKIITSIKDFQNKNKKHHLPLGSSVKKNQPSSSIPASTLSAIDKRKLKEKISLKKKQADRKKKQAERIKSEANFRKEMQKKQEVEKTKKKKRMFGFLKGKKKKK